MHGMYLGGKRSNSLKFNLLLIFLSRNAIS